MWIVESWKEQTEISILLINSHQVWNFNLSHPTIPSDPDRTNHGHPTIASPKLDVDRWDPPRPRPPARSPNHLSLYRSLCLRLLVPFLGLRWTCTRSWRRSERARTRRCTRWGWRRTCGIATLKIEDLVKPVDVDHRINIPYYFRIANNLLIHVKHHDRIPFLSSIGVG
jgi:hypothetical protein